MFLILTCVVFPGSYTVNQLSRSPSQARHQGAGRGILRCAGEWPGVSRGRGGLYTAQIVSWPSAQHAASKLDPGKNDNINNAE